MDRLDTLPNPWNQSTASLSKKLGFLAGWGSASWWVFVSISSEVEVMVVLILVLGFIGEVVRMRMRVRVRVGAKMGIRMKMRMKTQCFIVNGLFGEIKRGLGKVCYY